MMRLPKTVSGLLGTEEARFRNEPVWPVGGNKVSFHGTASG